MRGFNLVEKIVCVQESINGRIGLYETQRSVLLIRTHLNLYQLIKKTQLTLGQYFSLEDGPRDLIIPKRSSINFVNIDIHLDENDRDGYDRGQVDQFLYCFRDYHLYSLI